MALIEYVTEENASGKAREYYDERAEESGPESRYAEIRAEKGRSLYSELRLNNPDVVEAQKEFSRRILQSGLVDEDLFEIVMVAVAQENDCDYCAGSHRENLDLLLDMDEEAIKDTAEGDFSSLPKRERVLAEFATRCIKDPHRINDSDIDRLYGVGFDDSDIIQLLVTVGICNTANLIVNSMNAHPSDLDRKFRY